MSETSKNLLYFIFFEVLAKSRFQLIHEGNLISDQ